MIEPKPLAPGLVVTGQFGVADVARALEEGVTLIVNNRPDGEEPGQAAGADIEAAARAAGIAYRAIPIGSTGFSQPQVDAMRDALDSAAGPVLAFCRSGTRSTLLWALAEAKRGRDPEDIARDAAEAGYDVGPVRPAMDMLAGKSAG
ncbi:TIGR01244 family sulfur transferase [Qipengyuania sp. MTN3-11]|uniref:TIGR01244 family sulfur transferase n=1 Tax=Qipengyuania sp. MTN3-11 TaxID=3056557 RepID=UPI0036F397B7